MTTLLTIPQRSTSSSLRATLLATSAGTEKPLRQRTGFRRFSYEFTQNNELILSGFFLYLAGTFGGYAKGLIQKDLKTFMEKYMLGKFIVVFFFLYFASAFANNDEKADAWTRKPWARLVITLILLAIYVFLSTLDTLGFLVTLTLLFLVYALNDIATNTDISPDQKDVVREAAAITTIATITWAVGAFVGTIVRKRKITSPLFHEERWLPPKGSGRTT